MVVKVANSMLQTPISQKKTFNVTIGVTALINCIHLLKKRSPKEMLPTSASKLICANKELELRIRTDQQNFSVVWNWPTSKKRSQPLIYTKALFANFPIPNKVLSEPILISLNLCP